MSAAAAAAGANGVGYIGSGSFAASEDDSPSATPKGTPPGFVRAEVANQLSKTIEKLMARLEQYEKNSLPEPSLTRTYSTSRSNTAPMGSADYAADDTDTLTRAQAEKIALQLQLTNANTQLAAVKKAHEGLSQERDMLMGLITTKDKQREELISGQRATLAQVNQTNLGLQAQIRRVTRIAYVLAAALGTTLITGAAYFGGDCFRRLYNKDG